MQRAAAANAARESPQSSPPTTTTTTNNETSNSKRQKLSKSASSPTPANRPALSELEIISAAVAAEEDKRREALSRQAAEAGESEWVLDVSGIPPLEPQPFIVTAGSLDEDDYNSNNTNNGGQWVNRGRQSYGNFKRKNKVIIFPPFLLVHITYDYFYSR